MAAAFGTAYAVAHAPEKGSKAQLQFEEDVAFAFGKDRQK